MIVAILDFGTNTFNLLIAEKGEHGLKILYSGKQGVKLGRGGIEHGIITPEAMERGYAAIENHLRTIQSYGADEIHAFATAAIRSANNGNTFVSLVKKKYGLDIQVIDGNREAELIYKGVRMAAPLTDDNALILDIGGGSNEFIICNRNRIFWKQSFNLGMARILEKFDLSDPVSSKNISALESYFDNELQELFEQCKHYQPKMLVGASGTFDTFRSLIENWKGIEGGAVPSFQIIMEEYRNIHKKLVGSNLLERKEMPGMEPVRVEMIVPATIFVNFVMRRCEIKEIYQSAYSLKEGVMAELYEI